MAGEGNFKRTTPLAELKRNPTPALWLVELRNCLVVNGPRSYTLNQLGSIAEHCDHQIILSENPDVTRSTLITAIEKLLAEHPPEQVKLNTLCSQTSWWGRFSRASTIRVRKLLFKVTN